MYIGTMHGYALELLRRLAPVTFKFSVLTEITARLFIESQQSKGATISSSYRTLAKLTGSVGAKLGAIDHRRPATPGTSRQ
jgi:DNA helicase-2/ATP-dependent DNA helicase PcrA